VNQYEYLTSIGARGLLAAERVGYAELTASTNRREMHKAVERNSFYWRIGIAHSGHDSTQ